MVKLIFDFSKIILLSFLILTLQHCIVPSKNDSEESKILIEDHLIPSIQILSESRYYNIEDRMLHYQIPGFSMALIKNGDVVASKGYGYARKEDQILVDTNTIFQVGSISKTITALVILKLRDSGKVDLDINVDQYLKTWELPTNKFTRTKSITLRNLLNHTSGMNNDNSKGFTEEESLPSLLDMLDGKSIAKAASIDTFPGSYYKYSNIGYAILQVIIEDLTNEKFEDIAQRMIFDPLDMSNSTFKTIYPSNSNTQYCYSYDKNGKPQKGYWNYLVPKTSGDLKTTALDLAKMCIAIQESLLTDHGFISMATAKEMMAGNTYGLGLEIEGTDRDFRFTHSGRVSGFFAYMTYYPNRGEGAVILTNSDNGGELFQEILRGLSELNTWDILHPKTIKTVETTQSLLDRYIGSYVAIIANTEYIIHIKQVGKHLQYFMEGDEEDIYSLRALSSTEFIDITDGEEFVFSDIADRANQLITNGEYTFVRVE